MNKKSLSELLKRLDNTLNQEGQEMSNLNDQLAKKMLKGGYGSTNTECNGGSNSSCENTSCVDGTNYVCWNHSCLI